ncbi:hypothetical protein [Mucilaginibacter sp.]
MPIIPENLLDVTIGKNGFFAPRTSLQCTQYVCGISYFDALIEAKSILGNAIPTNIHLRPTGVEISIMYRFKLQKIGLHYSDIVSIHIESKDKVTELKEKSVIGRALLGGLLFGPAGAIVGGITGIGTKEKVLFEPDLILTVIYVDNEQEKAIVFTCKNAKKASLYKDAKAVFGSKLQP